nr:MAG TPA: hypothetical protein [Caudoviricetes sp.]
MFNILYFGNKLYESSGKATLLYVNFFEMRILRLLWCTSTELKEDIQQFKKTDYYEWNFA